MKEITINYFFDEPNDLSKINYQLSSKKFCKEFEGYKKSSIKFDEDIGLINLRNKDKSIKIAFTGNRIEIESNLSEKKTEEIFSQLEKCLNQKNEKIIPKFSSKIINFSVQKKDYILNDEKLIDLKKRLSKEYEEVDYVGVVLRVKKTEKDEEKLFRIGYDGSKQFDEKVITFDYEKEINKFIEKEM